VQTEVENWCSWEGLRTVIKLEDVLPHDRYRFICKKARGCPPSLLATLHKTAAARDSLLLAPQGTAPFESADEDRLVWGAGPALSMLGGPVKKDRIELELVPTDA
jgi:hypothetical protein